jgi:hypothetical protein
MSSLTGRVRFATLLAVGAILVASGLVVRAVEINPLKIGQENLSGVAMTSLEGVNAESVLQVAQNGPGVAVRGTTGAGAGVAGYFSSTNGTGALTITGSPDEVAMIARSAASTTGRGAAVHADGRQNVAVVATSNATSAVIATSTGPGSAAVRANDRSPDGAGFAVVATGDVSITGSLALTEGCTGCTPFALAANASSEPIRQGDAVTFAGISVGPDGSTVVQVRPALRHENVFGVADRGLILAASGDERSEIRAKWLDGGTEIPHGGSLRVALSGLLTLEGSLPGLDPGDGLWVGLTPGQLQPKQLGVDRVGQYLGERPDGRGVILVAIDGD